MQTQSPPVDDPISPAVRAQRLLTFALGIVGLAAVLVLWILPARRSFWLDETVLFAFIHNGLDRSLSDTSIWSQSALFSCIEWAAARIAGESEIALRTPSILAGVGALYVLYRIGFEALDRETGIIFAALYLAVPQVAGEIPNARPYALALLAQTAGLLFLLRWVRSGRFRQVLLFSLCAVFAIYMQPLFAIALPFEAGFLLIQSWQSWAARLPQLAVVALIGALLLMPLIAQISKLSGAHARLVMHAFEPNAFVEAVAPVVLILTVLAIAVLATDRENFQLPHRRDVFLLGAFLLASPAVLFVASRYFAAGLFLPRYLLPSAPGIVFFWGFLLRGVKAEGVRKILLILPVAILTITIMSGLPIVDYPNDGWREVVRSIPKDDAIVLYDGLIESRNLESVGSPERWTFFASPVLSYQPDRSKSSLLLLPFNCQMPDKRYVDSVLPEFIGNRSRMNILLRDSYADPGTNPPKAWVDWLSSRLQQSGFRLQSSKLYGRVRKLSFSRAQVIRR